MPTLLIRPDRQDTRVVRDLLAPGGGPRRLAGRPSVSGLVVDATMASAAKEFAATATASGVPALIDPLTFGLQVRPSVTSPFSPLPYACHATLNPATLDLPALTASCLEHQLSMGGTALVAPYFYVRDLADGWAAAALEAIRSGAAHREAMGLNISSLAVLCGNRRTLASPAGLAYIDEFTATARRARVDMLAVCVSPAGKPGDSYDSIARLGSVVERATRSGLPVLAWRQGAFGLTMAAAGAEGYESGIGQNEASDIVGLQGRVRNHAPLPADQPFARQKRPVYMPAFGRSIPRRAAVMLMRSPAVQGELLCGIPGCCPTADDTLQQQRHHAVRARAHQLEELAGQPARWRMQHVMRSLEGAVGSARRANEVLERADDSFRVPIGTLSAQIEYLRYRIDIAATGRSA